MNQKLPTDTQNNAPGKIKGVSNITWIPPAANPDALPPSIQEFLVLGKFNAAMRSIEETHKLHIDTTELLEQQTLAVIYGLNEAKEFVDDLQLVLHIPKETAITLAEDINKLVFLPMKEALKKETEEGPDPDSPFAQAVTAKPSEETGLSENIHDKLTRPIIRTVGKQPSNLEDNTAQKMTPKIKSAYGGGDPYREPIEEQDKM